MARLLTAIAVVVLVMAPPALAADGTLTVSGNDGVDELRLAVVQDDNGRDQWIITPAPPAVATTGLISCASPGDPLTGRPVRTVCRPQANALIDISFGLGGGNDSLLVGSGFNIASATASGGAGNDLIELSTRTPRTLNGGDGDDTLVAPARDVATPVILNGGAGRDLVDYSDIGGLLGEPGGVTVNLATGQATSLVSQGFGASGPRTRVDTLTSIERVLGSPMGDVLIGGPGADELIGGEGPDNLTGADGADTLNGGVGEDNVNGGKGGDTLDGGPGLDTYAKGDGGDTFLMRDGFIDKASCFDKDVVINDLVDSVLEPAKCLSISTAAAKHKRDTRLTRRALRIGQGNLVRAALACPRGKAERCEGALRLRLGGPRGRALARARYRVRRGARTRLKLRLTAAEAASARGRAVTLDAREVDGDGRPRSVLSRVSVRR